jgi:hypothetical protein
VSLLRLCNYTVGSSELQIYTIRMSTFTQFRQKSLLEIIYSLQMSQILVAPRKLQKPVLLHNGHKKRLTLFRQLQSIAEGELQVKYCGAMAQTPRYNRRLTFSFSKKTRNIQSRRTEISYVKKEGTLTERNKWVTCNIWSTALCGAETWTLRKIDLKYSAFGKSLCTYKSCHSE